MHRTIHSTRRLVLRPYRISDFAAWREAYVKRLPARNAWDRGPLAPARCTRAVFSKLVRRHESLARNDKVYIYGIFEKRTGALVGAIDIAVFVREDRHYANLGWQLHNRHWGKGYAREATAKALRIAVQELKIHRLEAAINIGNVRSLRLARAVGMHYEGIKRNYLFEGGKWVDHHVFVVTPEMKRPRSRHR